LGSRRRRRIIDCKLTVGIRSVVDLSLLIMLLVAHLSLEGILHLIWIGI
jgi:hypothetical protein